MEHTVETKDAFQISLENDVKNAIDLVKTNDSKATNPSPDYFGCVTAETKTRQVYIDVDRFLKGYAEFQSEVSLKEKNQPYAVLTPEDLRLALPYYLKKAGYLFFHEDYAMSLLELGYTVIPVTDNQIRYAVEKFVKKLDKENGKRGKYVYRSENNKPFNLEVLERALSYLEVISEMTVDRSVTDVELVKMVKAKVEIEKVVANLKDIIIN